MHPGKGAFSVYHDVSGSFDTLIREATKGPVGVALGPIYADDPASAILAPFVRSARETKWGELTDDVLAPQHVLDHVADVRTYAASSSLDSLDPVSIDDWTRAGLVLEIASRRGVHLVGRGVVHPRWKLRGTITGRFGVETVHGASWTFNPMSLGPEDRQRVRPSDSVRNIAVIDYRAMDLCSMTSLVPGMAEKYRGAPDPHMRTAELLLPQDQVSWAVRDIFKNLLFVYAYGGNVDPPIRELFQRGLPELDWFRTMPHGDGARRVQETSARAFRAGLSNALPLLMGGHFIPMFTVHDELVLDVSDVGLTMIDDVTKALEEGSSQRIGVPYGVGVKIGYTYAEAKGS